MPTVRRREERREGDVSVRTADVKLVTAPRLPLALAVALAAPVTVPWQQGEILVRSSVALCAERGLGLLLFCLRLALALLARVNRGRVVADVEHSVPPQRGLHEIGVDERRDLVLRELVVCAADRRFARDVGDRLPSAEAAQHRRLPDDQEGVLRGGEVAQGLEDQHLEDRHAAGGRMSVAAPAVFLETSAVERCRADSDELLLALAEFANFVLNASKEVGLDRKPLRREEDKIAFHRFPFHLKRWHYTI